MGVVPSYVNPEKTCPTDFWSYDLQLHGVAVQALFLMPRLDAIAEEEASSTEATMAAEAPAPAVAPSRPYRKRAPPPSEFVEERRLVAPVQQQHMSSGGKGKGRAKNT